MKYLIQTRQEGPKFLATVSKEGPYDQREGASWEPLHVALGATEQIALYSVLREWQDKEVQNAELPHSRACGIHHHKHGLACSSDCPTCGGKSLSLKTLADSV